MKLLITLILIMAHNSYGHECKNKVDPRKVVFFLDANASWQEAKSARDAACKRGESFELFPGTMEELILLDKNISPIKSKMARLEKILQNFMLKENSQPYDVNLLDKIKSLEEENNALYKKLEQELAKYPRLKTDELENKFKKMAKEGRAITSLIGSGHDGGGQIHGETGDNSIDKYEIISAFQSAYADQPALKSKLESLFLWGCYTATPGEVDQWAQAVPSLRLIVGFYGSAPSNAQESSSSMLNDSLIRSSRACNEESKVKRDLLQLTKEIDGFSNNNSAIWRKSCIEKGQESYLFRNLDEFGGFRKGFTKDFKKKKCKLIKSDDSDLEGAFYEYFEGYIPLPDDTSHGKLRNLYSYLRQGEGCISIKNFSPDKVGLLLFFKKGVVKNFFQTFKDEFNKAKQSLQDLKSLSSLSDDDQASIDFVQIKLEAGLSTRADVVSWEEQMERIATRNSILRNPDAQEAAKPFISFGKIFHRYLYELDPRCMNFLEWHEYQPGRIKSGMCEIK